MGFAGIRPSCNPRVGENQYEAFSDIDKADWAKRCRYMSQHRQWGDTIMLLIVVVYEIVAILM